MGIYREEEEVEESIPVNRRARSERYRSFGSGNVKKLRIRFDPHGYEVENVCVVVVLTDTKTMKKKEKSK